MELKKRRDAGLPVAYNLSLFSSAALRDTPEAILKLHQDYLKAGCQVLTTASYAVTRFYLQKVGEAHRVKELAELSVSLARQAICMEKMQSKCLVAASVPPLGESYHEAGLPEADMREQYAELLSGLVNADLFILETMASLADAEIAVSCSRAASPNKTIWVSFTPRQGNAGRATLKDTSISHAVRRMLELGVEAVLFNCATPEIIGLAIEEAAEEKSRSGQHELATLANQSTEGLRLGGYGNFWEEFDPTGWSIEKNESECGKGDQKSGGFVVRKDFTSRKYITHASRWQSLGATIIGGCCGIGPDIMKDVGEAWRLCNGCR